MRDAGLPKGLLPLRLKYGGDEEECIGDDLVEEEKDGLPRLAEAHLIGEEAFAPKGRQGMLSCAHPRESGDLMGVGDEGSEGDDDWWDYDGPRRGDRIRYALCIAERRVVKLYCDRVLAIGRLYSLGA